MATTTRKKPKAPTPSGSMTDNMTEAAQAAIAENDRLGIPSVRASNGKRVVRQLPKKAPTP